MPADVVTVLGVGAVLALILANGYFVAAEFGFVAARRSNLEQLARSRDRKAARAVEVHRRLSFMLSGAQLGITVTSLVVGLIAEPTIGRALEPVVGWFGVGTEARAGIAFAVGFGLATAIQMVLGELAPKNMAIACPEAFARALAGSMLVFLRLAGPVVRLFDSAANRLVRLAGIEPVEELVSGVSADELEYIVEESARERSLSQEQAALLGRALQFRQLSAANAMVPRTRVDTLPSHATGADLRRALRRHSRFPVTRDEATADEAVGVVQAADLLRVPVTDRPTVRVEELMRPVVAVPETLPLSEVLRALRGNRSQLAVVVDEHGGTAGIITLEDLVEELVGPIADEHDTPEARVEPAGEGRWSVPGWWRMDEVRRDTGLDLPESDDYDTVSGYVMATLGRIPVPGDIVGAPGATVEVTAMRGRAVDRVILYRGGAEGDSP